MNSIDAVNENIPIFIRISEGIKDHILMGDVKEGEKLISTTQLSKEFDINIATVNKGVNVLVSEGIVYKKRGIGMFIAEGAVDKLIKKASKQADSIVIQFKSDMDLNVLSDVINNRVNLRDNITDITVIIGNKDAYYTRARIIEDGFKIQKEDFK